MTTKLVIILKIPRRKRNLEIHFVVYVLDKNFSSINLLWYFCQAYKKLAILSVNYEFENGTKL